MINPVPPAALLLACLLAHAGPAQADQGFYRFNQWQAPGWGYPGLGATPGYSYHYWYQPYFTPNQGYQGYQGDYGTQGPYYWYWFQPYHFIPQQGSPGLQGPAYWYWFQPYY